MAKKNKKIKTIKPDNKQAERSFNYSILIKSIVVLLSVAGALMYIFGKTLIDSQDALAAFSQFYKDMLPTPVMLENFKYKAEALAQFLKITGATVFILFSVLFLLLFKMKITSDKMRAVANRLSGFFGGRAGVKTISFSVASSFIVLVSSILLISAVILLSGRSMNILIFPSSLLISLVSLFLILKKHPASDNAKAIIISFVIYTLIFLGSYVISSSIYDNGYDSLSYHQASIIQLSKGWDPYIRGDQLMPKGFVPEPQTDTFAKASEICAASLYKITGSIEGGKVFNFLLIAASLMMVFSSLVSYSWMRTRWAFVFSCLLAFNSVVVCQSLSYYVDGQLYSVLLVFLAVLALMIKEGGLIYPVIAGLCSIILINLKLTGLLYCFVFSVFLLPVIFFRDGLKKFVISGVIIFVFALTGFFVVGYNPYITNHIDHGHIFHPFLGSKSTIDNDNHGAPVLAGKNNIEKLFVSTFSESMNYYTAKMLDYQFKVPFTVNSQELICFANTDTRIGGFGPLFGGILIASSLLLFTLFFFDRGAARAALAVIALILFSVVIVVACWWARFVPQLWAIPVVALIASAKVDRIWMRYSSFAIILFISLNIIIVSGVYLLSQVAATGSLNRQLEELKAKNSLIDVYSPMRSSILKLDKFGIKYNEVAPESFVSEYATIASDFVVIYYMAGKK